MIVDEKKRIRKLGFRKIVKASESASKADSIRYFLAPSINFQAIDYMK